MTHGVRARCASGSGRRVDDVSEGEVGGAREEMSERVECAKRMIEEVLPSGTRPSMESNLKSVFLAGYLWGMCAEEEGFREKILEYLTVGKRDGGHTGDGG